MIQSLFFFFFSPSKLYSSRVRHLISGSSISTGSERRSVSAYNGIKWADLKAGPEWEMALRVLFHAFVWKFTHSRNFDPPLVDFFASLAITCMWKGRKVSTSRGEPEWSEYKMGIAFFDIMVLTELSHKLFFSPLFFAGKPWTLYVYRYMFLASCQPEGRRWAHAPQHRYTVVSRCAMWSCHSETGKHITWFNSWIRISHNHDYAI